MDPSCASTQEISSQKQETIPVCTKQKDDYNNNNNNNSKSMNVQDHQKRPRPQPEHALKCPRCESTNTKFCYYNNYSLSQPRYFCKSCRRYWTRGGTLRNVPVGGGCRKTKRSPPSASSKNMLKPSPFHDDPLITNPLITGLPSLGYDAVDLNAVLSRLQRKQSSFGPDEVSILGNSANQHCDVFGNSAGFFEEQNGNFGSGLGYGFVSCADTSTASMAMTSFEENNNKDGVFVSGISENPNKVLWGFPWQMTGEVSCDGDGEAEMDAGRQSWNGLSSSWHGLLNSPLM